MAKITSFCRLFLFESHAWSSNLVIIAALFFTVSSFAQTENPISIHWVGGVGCQEYGNEDDTRGKDILIENIEDSSCFRICERATVNYQLQNIPAGSTVVWNAIGGTIINATDINCVVEWGFAGLGNLTFQIITSDNTISKTLCIEKMGGPIASFNIIQDDSAEISYLTACANQTIYFNNTSQSNGGTAIVSYFWDFGDHTYSSAENPTHVYSEPGYYDVSLIVHNACNCSKKVQLRILVEDNGFDIICPAIVCEGQLATYSLPFDGKSVCNGNYNWSVIGGEIKNIDGNGDLTVNWNNVDSSGFGFVTFDPRNCDVTCYSPTTIKVPVILANGSISGPIKICSDQATIYKLPQWPTTNFHWEVVGNATGNLAEVILSDQRNEVIIKAFTTGFITLKATYVNTLTQCSGFATLKIQVGSTSTIVGSSEFCQGDAATFTTGGGEQAIWKLYHNNGTNPVATSALTAQFQHTFNAAGNYVLTTSNGADCLGEQKSITVADKPTAVTAANIQGNRIICPEQPYLYNIENADPNSVYLWTAQNGTFNSSQIGNSVNISFSNNGPHSLSVIRQSINPIICSSDPVTVNLNLQTVEVDMRSDGNISSVCANTYQDFFAYKAGTTQLYTDGETYTWALSNPNLGSVTEGQGTNSATILWNHATAAQSAQVILTISKCTLPPQIFTYNVAISPIPLTKLTTPNNIAQICSGTSVSITLTLLDGSPLPMGTQVMWDSGNGLPTMGLSTKNFIFTNNTTQNLDRIISAYIVNVGGCNVNSTPVLYSISVIPAPPASLSLSGGNSFCTEPEITTVLTIASSTSGMNNPIWYRDDQIIASQSDPNTYVVTLFGVYKFSIENDFGCKTFSNAITVIHDCPNTDVCILNPMPHLINTSYNDCGIIQLIGSTTGTPLSEKFKIIGPNINTDNFIGTQINAVAGVYHIFYSALYYCPNLETNIYLQELEDVTVPYVPKFSYEKQCNGNNNFTINLFDETNFFAPVTSRNVTYSYRVSGTPASSAILITGTQITNLPAGTYIITQQVSGDIDTYTQPSCSTELMVTLNTMPSAMQIELGGTINCHDTAVRFNVLYSSIEYSYEWTFEPGVKSTLRQPKRVFSAPGNYTVSVIVTNNSGCSQTLYLPVTIPESCFNGSVVSNPTPASVCGFQSVTLSYVANPSTPDNCVPDQYIWMNGLEPVTPAVNSASLVVLTEGSYWVRVFSELECEYATPNRISPIFKPEPTLILSGDASICSGEKYTVKAVSNASIISWSLNGIVQPQFNNDSTVEFNSLSPGTHLIVATATLNGCTKTNSISFVVTSMPANVSILAPEFLDCNPYTIKLTAQSSTPNVNYTWNNGMTGQSIVVNSGGPYKVTATVGGCSKSAEINVPKDPSYYSWIFPSGCYDICKANLGYLIGPRVPFKYWSWNKMGLSSLSATNSIPLPYHISGSGEYTFTYFNSYCNFTTEPFNTTEVDCKDCKIKDVTVKDIYNNEEKFCSYTLELDIDSSDFINAIISSPDDQLIFSPSAFNLAVGHNFYGFTIIPIDGFAGGIVELIIQGTDKDGNTCLYKFSIDIPSCNDDAKQFSPEASISSAEDINLIEFKMYPNPTNDEVTLSYLGLKSRHEITIFDITGRLMEKINTTNAESSTIIKMAKYPSGIYIVVLRKNGLLLSQHKLIKQ